MGFLFLPILFVRVFLERIGLIKKQGDRTKEESEKIYKFQFNTKSGVVDTVLGMLEAIEQRLMKKEARVPFGSSIIVVLRKG